MQLRVEGLECIAVSDRDGVMLVEGVSSRINLLAVKRDVHLLCTAHVDDVPLAVTRPPFLGVFSIASEQVRVVE